MVCIYISISVFTDHSNEHVGNITRWTRRKRKSGVSRLSCVSESIVRFNVIDKHFDNLQLLYPKNSLYTQDLGEATAILDMTQGIETWYWARSSPDVLWSQVQLTFIRLFYIFIQIECKQPSIHIINWSR